VLSSITGLHRNRLFRILHCPFLFRYVRQGHAHALDDGLVDSITSLIIDILILELRVFVLWTLVLLWVFLGPSAKVQRPRPKAKAVFYNAMPASLPSLEVTSNSGLPPAIPPNKFIGETKGEILVWRVIPDLQPDSSGERSTIHPSNLISDPRSSTLNRLVASGRSQNILPWVRCPIGRRAHIIVSENPVSFFLSALMLATVTRVPGPSDPEALCLRPSEEAWHLPRWSCYYYFRFQPMDWNPDLLFCWFSHSDHCCPRDCGKFVVDARHHIWDQDCRGDAKAAKQ